MTDRSASYTSRFQNGQNWTASAALIFSLAAVALFLGLSVIAGYFSRLVIRLAEAIAPKLTSSLFDGAPDLFLVMPTMLLLYGMLALIFFRSRRIRDGFERHCWFARPRHGWWELFPAIVLSVFTMAIVNVAYSGILESLLGPNPVIDKNVVALGEFAANPIQLTLLIAVTVVGAPLIEELLFRGLIFKALDRALPTWAAALISAFLFAAVHLDLKTIVPLIVFGLISACLVKITRSLIPSIAFHTVYNGIIIGAATGLL